MIEALLKYQEVDARLRKIEVELASSEERKKAVSAKKYLDGVEESISKLESRAFELNVAFENATAELEKMKGQEAEFKKAMEEMEEESEANYLIKKTEEILAKIRLLSQEVNKISGEIQAVIKEYSTIKNTTKAAQTQYAEYGKLYNELKASKQAEMEQIESELKKLQKDVEPSLMEKYLKKRKEKIFPILFEIRDNVCGACNMELPTGVISKIKNGEVIECDQCRRLLYKL